MQPGLGYPFVAITGREEDRTVGRLISWQDMGAGEFARKLRDADDIEEVDDGLYDRRVATFRPDADAGGEPVEAHFYFQTSVPAGAKRVPRGDWLRRGDDEDDA